MRPTAAAVAAGARRARRTSRPQFKRDSLDGGHSEILCDWQIMNRELSPVFLQARAAIEGRLAKYGFRLTREVFDHAAFGSAEAEYRHQAHWLRLTWDGKDRYLWLSGAISPDQHAHPGPAAWHSLDASLAESAAVFLEPGPTTDARIADLLTQIESFRTSKART